MAWFLTEPFCFERSKIKDMKPSFLLSLKAGSVFMIVCLSAILLVTSCGKKYDPVPEPVGDAKVRFVNAVQGGQAQDFFVNGGKKNTTPLAYGEVSEYLTISSGSNAFSFNNTGTTVVNASTPAYSFPIGISGTVFYLKTLSGTLGAFALGDDMTAPAAGKAKVRFINMNSYSGSNAITVSQVGSTDVMIPSLTFVDPNSNLGFPYFAVDAGVKFKLTMPGATEVEFDGAIAAGKNYTIWIDGSSAAVMTAHAIVQN